MIKNCLVCGKEFQASPSAKKVTCSKECMKIRRKQVSQGRKIPSTTIAALSSSAKQRGFTENLKKGTPAAMASPKSGRFETNVSAKSWILVSPSGERYECRNLMCFIRKNPHLFCIDGSNDDEVRRISAGFRTIKRNIRLNRKGQSYLGWTLEFPNETEEKYEI